MGDCGWAARLLEWHWAGRRWEAEVSVARYVVVGLRHEALAHAEVRDRSGRYRVEIGSFPTVALAREAAERDAQLRCRRDREERVGVDVRISPGRRRVPERKQAGTSPGRPAGDAGAALD